MKKFKVYSHPVLGAQAVKFGFSWPGFFFGWIWAMVKKMWGAGFAILGVYLLLGVVQGIFEAENSGGGSALMGIITLAVSIGVGLKGNEFYCKSLEKRGFQFVSEVIASNKDGALAEATA